MVWLDSTLPVGRTLSTKLLVAVLATACTTTHGDAGDVTEGSGEGDGDSSGAGLPDLGDDDGDGPEPGASWEVLDSGVDVDLDAVWAADERVLVAGVGGAILESIDAGRTWEALASGTTADIHGVWVTGTHIYAVGDAGTIVHSDDDGETFVTELSNTELDLYCVWASDPSNVFVSGESGFTRRSTDLGLSWDSVSGPALGDVVGLWGVDASHVFAASQTGVLFSSDAGDSWDLRVIGNSHNDLWSGDGDHLVVVNDAGRVTTYSIADDVATKHVPTAAHPLRAVWGRDLATIVAVGEGGTIFVPSDGEGGDWVTQTSPVSADFRDVFGTTQRIYAVGEGGTMIVRSDAP